MKNLRASLRLFFAALLSVSTWAMIKRTFWVALMNAIWVNMTLLGLTFDVPLIRDRDASLDRVVAGNQFNILRWEIAALGAKAMHELITPQHGMTDADQVAFVRETMKLTHDLDVLTAEIDKIYIAPDIKDAESASQPLRQRRTELQGQLHARQLLCEAIFQEQIESIVREEGFGLGGQILPPLRFRFTGLPDVMIISRRDKIERIDQRTLVAGLTVEDRLRLEQNVDRQFDVSSLITPIGGLGAYPTMLPQTASIRFAIEVAAHEWAHNYFVWRLAPIALNYGNDSTSRVINETSAVIFEREISKRVLTKYYPDVLGQAPRTESQVSSAKNQAWELGIGGDEAGRNSGLSTQHSDLRSAKGLGVARAEAQTKFDFNREMRVTRLRADELLAEGKIVEAEQYMEERRAIFVRNGYQIRKLNQAYFAFYGAYNAEPGGSATAGRDPIGPAVQRLRQQSANLGDFMHRVSQVRGLSDLP
ncbi:MAG: hypothetical protein KIH69_011830 [Anaerolineae bacterium]|nr:hypothetical protein [Anaerolineae bacterium]